MERRKEESRTPLDMEPDITLKVTGISVDRLQRNSVKCRQNRLDFQESRIIMEVKIWKILTSTDG